MTTLHTEAPIEQLSINTIRTLSMDAVEKANSGHPGTPMALAPLAYLLYTRAMKHSPKHPHWADRDRFVLSCGHASMLLYSSLYLSGYDVTLDDLKNFRQLGSPTAGHPEYGALPGIETTTGPLGQGIANSVGIAISEQMYAARFNRPGYDIVDHYTYVACSDGDLEEGVSSEASSLAGHLGLGKLIVFYDDNHISIEGKTELAFTENVGQRYEAYDWHVQNLGEDISLDRLEAAVEAAHADRGRPSLIIMRTHIATGAPNKQDTSGAHGTPLGADEIKLTKEAYGWPSLEPFFVPEEVKEHFAGLVKRGDVLYEDWRQRFNGYSKEFPELAAEYNRMLERRRPKDRKKARPIKDSNAGPAATRKSSSDAIQSFAKSVPELIGGSADLAPSTLTLINDSSGIEKGDFSGRNLHFGIREHAMGAIVNGLALNGFRAYGSTFLNFCDYMKPAMRIAALSEIPSIFVFTHDSIGLGEDGPTHQPIEQLATLRAMPNICVIRPADFNETALAWQFAIEQDNRPVALILSRQNVAAWDSDLIPDDAIERGAYVFSDCEHPAEVTLIGTGSELQLCVEAAEALEQDNVCVRVVSMPCWETFAEQNPEYRRSVLDPSCRARISVEAAASLGWERWVGCEGDSVAIDTFGESGPAAELFDHFGFSVEQVVERAHSLLRQIHN